MHHRIWTKLYPSCAATHRGIEGALELRRDEGVTPDDVEEIMVRISSLVRQSVPFDRPADGLEAKFSVPYCVASALVDGFVRLDSFSATAIDRPEVRRLLERVRVETYERTSDDEAERAEIEVVTSEDRRLRREVVEPRGSPERPASEAAIRDKFHECARGVLDEDRIDSVFERCLALDELPTARELTGAISRATRPARAASEPVGAIGG